MSRRREINREYVTVTKKLDVPEEKLSEYKEALICSIKIGEEKLQAMISKKL